MSSATSTGDAVKAAPVPLEASGPQMAPGAGVASPMLLVTKEAERAHLKPNMRLDPSETSAASSVLSRARAFLPAMARADVELRKSLEGLDDDERRAMHVDDVGDGDDFVEMNVGLVRRDEDEAWSSDSDPDSPPSPPREGEGNGFTSDSDSDSTISTTTGTDSDVDDDSEGGNGNNRKKDRRRRRGHRSNSTAAAATTRRSSTEFPRKRPMLIEEIHHKNELEEEQKAPEQKRTREDGGGLGDGL